MCWITVSPLLTPLAEARAGVDIGGMGSSKEAEAERDKVWRELITLQKQNGQSVRSFCKEKNVGEASFYYWRQRFRQREEPLCFALVETPNPMRPNKGEPIELTMTSGDRLLITPGADVPTLRMVLTVLRESRE